MPSKLKHKIIRSLIKQKNPIILEVGAHIGSDTKLFADYYAEASIYCFEPDLRNLEELHKLNNSIRNKLNIVEAAVSDENCEQKSFYQTPFSDSSSLKSGHPHIKDANVIRVKTIKLDDWACKNGIEKVDLLWIDVQGAEREVLNGAIRILNNTDYIFVEYGEIEYEGGMTRSETIQMLSDRFRTLEGYSSITEQGDLVFINKKLPLTKKIILESKIIGILRFFKYQYIKLKKIIILKKS